MKQVISWLGVDPVLFAVFAMLVFGGLIVAGWQIGAEDDPARPRVFRGETVTDDSRLADVGGTISDVEPGRVTVQDPSGPVPVAVNGAAIIQTLTPEQVENIAPGDWVFVGGTDDNVNPYIVTGVVVAADDQVR